MGCLTFRYRVLIITSGKRLLLFWGQNLFSTRMRSSRKIMIGHGCQARVVPVLLISRSSMTHRDCVSSWSPSDSIGMGVHGMLRGQWFHVVASSHSAETSSCASWACTTLAIVIGVSFGVGMGRHDLYSRLLVLGFWV